MEGIGNDMGGGHNRGITGVRKRQTKYALLYKHCLTKDSPLDLLRSFEIC